MPEKASRNCTTAYIVQPIAKPKSAVRASISRMEGVEVRVSRNAQSSDLANNKKNFVATLVAKVC